MEKAQVKLAAHIFLGPAAQFPDFQLSDLVRQRLTRPSDIAVHLCINICRGQRGVIEHECRRFLFGPAL